jgi:hypothetical protein
MYLQPTLLTRLLNYMVVNQGLQQCNLRPTLLLTKNYIVHNNVDTTYIGYNNVDTTYIVYNNVDPPVAVFTHHRLLFSPT